MLFKDLASIYNLPNISNFPNVYDFPRVGNICNEHRPVYCEQANAFTVTKKHLCTSNRRTLYDSHGNPLDSPNKRPNIGEHR